MNIYFKDAIMARRLEQISSHTMGSLAPQTPDLDSIVSELTLAEKVSLLSGADFWTTNPVPRLQVPPLKVSDGPNGARGGAFKGGVQSACFPACVSLAATFDRNLARQIGRALGEETKTKGATVLLGPTVCPHRDPRGGRNFESFSEDPVLAGELASEYIIGLQGEGVGATIKHFAVNESETKRFTIDARLSQRALREIYLKPFEIAIKKSEPWALMTSYNLVNGTHADSNKQLINKILRDEWRFDGLVMSDWGGVNSTAESLNAGHDLEMPGPGKFRTLEKVASAIKKGMLSEEVLDQRVRRVLQLLERTAKFENPTIDDEIAVDSPMHRQLIRKAGAEGMVLLKNDSNTLPLEATTLNSMAVIGLAKEFLGHGGGSAAVNAHHKITAYEALEEAIGSEVTLNYAEGVRILRNLRPMRDDVVDNTGEAGFTCKVASVDGRVETKKIPAATMMSIEKLDLGHVEIQGTFTPQVSGYHYISLATLGQTKVYINDKVIWNLERLSADPMAMLLGTATEERKQYEFVAGQSYSIRIEAVPVTGTENDLSILSNPLVCLNFGFALQEEFEADLLPDAQAAARKSDVAVVFVGHTPVWETEGCDRDGMALPVNGSQDRLIEAVASVNKRTIVVNSTGSPISMPWIDDVAAVVQAWFPGQEAGHSIVDVILGKTNPAGKLPVTFPRRIEDAPAYNNFPHTGDLKDLHVDYDEGIYIGYRHYDRVEDSVLFPFGYGLSYTSFDINNIRLSSSTISPSSTVSISASIKNTGNAVGSEVVQVYVGFSHSEKYDRPTKTLAGFAKACDLQPGYQENVAISISVQEIFAHWDEDRYSWIVPSGRYMVYVGTSSRDADILAKIAVVVESEGVFAP